MLLDQMYVEKCRHYEYKISQLNFLIAMTKATPASEEIRFEKKHQTYVELFNYFDRTIPVVIKKFFNFLFPQPKRRPYALEVIAASQSFNDKKFEFERLLKGRFKRMKSQSERDKQFVDNLTTNQYYFITNFWTIFDELNEKSL
jgi:hypothetical protein